MHSEDEDDGRWWQWRDNTLVLRLRLQPRASREKLGDPLGDRLKAYVTAPPVEGAANERLLKMVARQCGVARSRVTLEAGATNREKTVAVVAPARLLPPLDVCKPPATR
ncbi:DUF167 domain-containing protein [Ectothiorhodospira lacustris]|uniref:DUF167 domain-containing protein n=1 Tax=Ectothiorhodospira lacustris TaxID=2899127 RepID=UPI001EE83A6B|nr:DUF167 family protein [Ectothiorhodospira lacustris]MCG5500134.1 DUF167 family protein [Ectothiorhodospira lacustris]MCG5510781.1 DUF167 family protein [Ectothiorhodospira lacustris]MCG5522513.1 DUF167 family protein [Ectothiorhodospira lacustris]